MDFNLSEIPQANWHNRAVIEANKIKKNPSFKTQTMWENGKYVPRTFEDLLWRTKQGHACEQYLMQYCGYTDDEREYRDVIDPEGNPVEVKACNPDYIEVNLERWAKEKTEVNDQGVRWKGWPDILQVWGNHSKVRGEIVEEYKYLGKYEWDETHLKWRKINVHV